MCFLWRSITFFILFTTFFSGSYAQVKPDPKREFRGVWIATVTNIDWPKSARSTSDKQIKELTDLIEAHYQQGINAIMFQIRPAADALYAKSREPWSQWLTGKQGKAPDPFYDPLQLAVTEAHKRGIELHAWFNPYRAGFYANDMNISPSHITKQKPEWFFTYGGRKLFNPGIPEVREYIIKVVLDVVDNYDIDGVHMDDYFYPYPIAGQKINDSQTFKDYNPTNIVNLDDWRRNNVDLLIKSLTDSVHKHKPYMKFGISPFGIWKNKRQDPELGSETSGGSSFYEQYADSRKWVKEHWVDYINPQIYWNFGYRPAAFEKLVDWWSNNTYDRHLYIGQAAYRINEIRNPGFKLSSQVPDQIKYLRKNPRVQGSVFFSSASLMANPLGFTDSLKNTYYRYMALPPAMLWLDSIAPNAPKITSVKIESQKAVTLNWQTPPLAKDKQPVYGYVVYRFDQGEKVNVDRPENIIYIQYSTDTVYEDDNVENGKTYQYVITAIDRLKNESYPSAPVTVPVK
jgi:uncharacterized lipoprotein YddW (UPF0748 family)